MGNILQLIKGGILATHFYKEGNLKSYKCHYLSTCYMFIISELSTILTQIHPFSKWSLNTYYVLGTPISTKSAKIVKYKNPVSHT